MMKNCITRKPSELSFTIFETIVAVGLLMAFTLEMAGGQGSVVSKVEYARHSNDAIWLAKRIMAQVEYNYQTHDLKELDLVNPLRDQPIKVEGETDFEYTYTVDVREWKFPLFDFLLKGGSGKSDDKDKDEPKSAEAKKSNPGGLPGIEAIINQIFKGHVMKVAHVDVSWPEGARRDSIGLTYLLTNSRALDEYLITKKVVWEGVLKKMAGNVQTPLPGLWKTDPPASTAMEGYVLFPDQSKRFPDGTHLAVDGTQLPNIPIPTKP